MYGKYIESTNQCSLFLKESQVLMNKIRDIDSSLTNQNEIFLFYTLPFGKENINNSENSHILNATLEYILSAEKFNVPFLNKSIPLQLITTIIMNDSILFELNIPF